MVLQVAPFEVPMEELANFIESASLETGGGSDAFVDRPADLVGPIPTFSADPRTIAAGDWSGVEHIGWRALTRRGSEATSVLDMFSGQEGVSFSQRGLDAANAFERALEKVAQFEDVDKLYEIRWLTLPVIYLTAVWLSGDPDEFIPTRLGGRNRVDPVVITREQLQALAAELVEQSSGATEAEEGSFSDLPGSRSGL